MGERHSGVLTACALVVLAAVLEVSPAVAQTLPLSGTWSEEVALGTDRPPWGSRFTTIHDGSRFTVIGPDGVSTFVLGGTARDTQVAMSSCSSTLRRIEANLRGGEVIITESIVTRSGAARGHTRRACSMTARSLAFRRQVPRAEPWRSIR